MLVYSSQFLVFTDYYLEAMQFGNQTDTAIRSVHETSWSRKEKKQSSEEHGTGKPKL
jgi:hypothetical protein